jgi:hypothetical protein
MKKNDAEENRMTSLSGAYKHYCPEWDFLAIDETCPEFAACLCYGSPYKQVITKENCDLFLKALLGKDELIEKWWTGKNLGFDSQTPREVFDSGEEGKERVYEYILHYAMK